MEELVVVVARDGIGAEPEPSEPLLRVRVADLGVNFTQFAFSMAAKVC